MKHFYVLNWDFNSDSLEHYDIIPYLKECYDRSKNKPKTINEFKEFIKREAQYQWWSRCEYEIIIHGFPHRKKETKVDIYQQVMMNIDIITDILAKLTKSK